MDCPHCSKAFHDNWTDVDIQHTAHAGVSSRWVARGTVCPACGNSTFDLRKFHLGPVQMNPNQQQWQKVDDFRIYPTSTFRKPTPTEVPPDIKEDYEEACRVLPISQKASAALSRRCLQAILRGEGYTQRDLAQQIDALLNEPNTAKAVPTALRLTVDAIRNFGNFSAHPVTDQSTLQVIAVEPGEAEWCLDILEEMFDHYYVKPAQAAARKTALDAKLAAAGKPPSR
jgi:hypothetical protein